MPSNTTYAPQLTRLTVALVAIMAAMSLAQPVEHGVTGPSETAPWRLLDVVDPRLAGLPANVRPVSGQLVQVDWAALNATLESAPRQGDARAMTRPLIIALPLPDGGFAHFEVMRSDLLAPELAARYPAIRTYRVRGVEDPAAWGVIDRTHQGFHAMVIANSRSVLGGTFFIDPYAFGDVTTVTSYYRGDARIDGGWQCSLIDSAERANAPLDGAYGARAVTAQKYRVYMAATGEYTAFHSQPFAANKPAGLSALVTALSRVDVIFERELAIDFELKGDTDDYVFTNPSTDPYTNSSASTMMSQNQEALDGFLDLNRGNYDVGHVCGVGSGGIASLGGVCVPDRKGMGATTGTPPINDPFWVDYVAHEIGHQFGANHTFNATSGGGCTAARRVASTAYECGSGSTIMGYAGICSINANVQASTDAYFHFASRDEIYAHVVGIGLCGADIPTSNSSPSVSIPAGGYATIPIATPFRLSAVGVDPEGDVLTYTWEERDLGPAQDLTAADNGSSPLFRSFSPTTSAERIFPRMSDVLSGVFDGGERLPTTTRALRFRVTARDQGYYVGTGAADIEIYATAAAGPFTVTAPGSELIRAGEYTVTWNVANTFAPPVNCQRVNILLSFDGGLTFTYRLASDTPNDGSEVITLPDVPGGNYRVMVAAADHIFFAVSSGTFIIQPGLPPANDHCADASPIGNGSFIFSLQRAFPTLGLHSEACDPMSRDVYFRYTAACDGVAVFETGTSPSAITLFSECPFTGGVIPITCDAYGVGDTYVQSAIAMTTGQEVLVRVSSMGVDNNTITLTTSCTTDSLPPANDLCDNAALIARGQSINGTLLNANWEAWISACEYTSVWYRFTASCHAAEFTCDSGRLISAHAGECVGPDGYLAIGEPNEGGLSRIVFNTVPGQVYTIGVRQCCAAPAGRFNLSFSSECFPAPANDQCTTAQALPLNGLAAGTLIGSGAGPSACAGESAMPCIDDVFYSFTPPVAGTMSITLGSFSSSRPPYGFAITDGCAADSALLAWDVDPADGTLEASTRVEGERTYIIRVARGVLLNVEFGVGTFLIGSSFDADPPVNDSVNDAIAIADGTITGTTRFATVDGASTCGNTSASPDVWYTWTAPCTGEATFDTAGSAYDTVISVHRSRAGTTVDQLPGACNDDDGFDGASRIVVAVTQGRLYYIRVSGWNGAVGDFTLHAAFAAASLPNGCVAATPLNGGFEQSATDPGGFYVGMSGATLTHWSASDVELIGTYWTASDGRASLNLNGSSQGSIAQHIATPDVGDVYLLQFDMAANPEGGNRTTNLSVVATDNPVQVYEFTFNDAIHSGEQMGWTTKTYGFVATSPTTLISIAGDSSDGPYGPMIDNIRLVHGSNPDPGTVSYSVSAQFSSTVNPGSAWTFGSIDSTTAFNRFTVSDQYGISSLDRWRHGANGATPSAIRNNSGQTQFFGTASLPGRGVALQPGPLGEWAVARFTVPYDGRYLVHAWAMLTDPMGGDGFGLRMLVDGDEIAGEWYSNLYQFELIVEVLAGQVIDFVVDPQSTSDHDTVMIESIVTRVGELEPVGPGCAADFNQDGGIDGNDVDAFFIAWQEGQSSADVNQDGGVDGNDVEAFFVVWENGGC